LIPASAYAREGILSEALSLFTLTFLSRAARPSGATWARAPPRVEGVGMRSDIVPGAVFPDHGLSDHAAKRRKLSEPQRLNPMALVLSPGGFCPMDRRQAEGLLHFIANLRLPIVGSSRSAPTILAAWQQGRKELFYPYGKTLTFKRWVSRTSGHRVIPSYNSRDSKLMAKS
jgi:hypothetical protein